MKKLFKPLARWFGGLFPETLVKLRYFIRFHKFLNLNNPCTLNEKILYLSLRTDTTIWTSLADKHEVRKYVESLGLSNILVKEFGVWDSIDSFSLDILPNSFVLKTTHGCGDVLVVQDKSKLNEVSVKRRFGLFLKHRYGALEGGKHYMRIKPRLMAEELLKNDFVSLKYSSSIIDYKIWCFNGVPYYIMVCTNRQKESLDLSVYDTQWNIVKNAIKGGGKHNEGNAIPKPCCLEEMLEVAKILSKPFPCVRVDLYFIDGKIYFGELTFTSLGGLMDYYTNEFQMKLGNLIDLNYKC